MDPEEIDDYLANMGNMTSSKEHPCQGCNMPRLIGDIIGLERDMDPRLTEKYIGMRKEYIGF